jgi:hypothetical protein
MKDPAFLFYYQDFLVGTDEMSLAAVGAYIRCLCHQAHRGVISEKHMKKICNSYDLHNEIKMKFKIEQNDDEKNENEIFFYNERLRTELLKRKNYSESRASNRKGTKKDFKDMKITSKTYVPHMENEDEDINENEISKKRGVGKNKITMPFESENFAKIWQNWKEYKSKEFGFKFKSEQSEQSQLMSLTKIADANEEKAIKIIMQSMENGWKGFFELKTNHTNGNSKSNGNRSIEERLQSTFDLVDRMYGQ